MEEAGEAEPQVAVELQAAERQEARLVEQREARLAEQREERRGEQRAEAVVPHRAHLEHTSFVEQTATAVSPQVQPTTTPAQGVPAASLSTLNARTMPAQP